MKHSPCRICGNNELELVLDLGEQCLTGFFPEKTAADPPKVPLAIAKCPECHLIQLQDSFDIGVLYGEHYGYCSSLNAAMVAHLKDKVAFISALAGLKNGDIIVDIGSNDGTTLSFYPENILPVGFDPSAAKFSHMYRPDAQLYVDFFTAAKFNLELPGKKAKVVTSIAMFYDLERPQEFVDGVRDILAQDGVWHFEQSYLPAMLKAVAYDTVCHEHLEYYSLWQIKYMLDKAGLKIIDIQFNDVNGGSFAITAAHNGSQFKEATAAIAQTLATEQAMGLHSMAPYLEFKDKVMAHREAVRAAFAQMKNRGETVLGYGASTKGNVLLQFCNLGPQDMPAIVEVNSFKFGKYTPGSHIPIISETEAKALKPDVYFVLPWHFRDNLVKREAEFLNKGGKMLFPLPGMELVGG